MRTIPSFSSAFHTCRSSYCSNEAQICYLSLLLGGQITFIPPVHHVIPWSFALPIYPLCFLPYYFTYRSVTSTASFITPESLPAQMSEYPYDRIIFHPGLICSTCGLRKPARSKHCRLCRHCVHRLDHHCVWVMNCLGRANYVHFLGMLLSLATMLAYGAFLGWRILDNTIQDMTDASRSTTNELERGLRWSKGIPWGFWFDKWTWAFAAHIRVGASSLLAGMTAPLAAGLLGYHLYLIWAGMTTNESFKWEEWSEDVQDGYVYSCTDPDHPRPDRTSNGTDAANAEDGVMKVTVSFEKEGEELKTTWPISPKQRLVSRANKVSLDTELIPGTVLGAEPWVKVESMEEIINIYDLGFWRNMKDALNVQ